jgi:nitrogen fixation protein
MRTVRIPEQFEKYIISREEDISFQGERIRLKFENGWGASVIHLKGSYGLELAVINQDDALDYTTEVSQGDVRGYLSQKELEDCLSEIQKL